MAENIENETHTQNTKRNIPDWKGTSNNSKQRTRISKWIREKPSRYTTRNYPIIPSTLAATFRVLFPVKIQESAGSNEASPLTNLQSAPSWRRSKEEAKSCGSQDKGAGEEGDRAPKFPHFLSSREGCRLHDPELFNSSDPRYRGIPFNSLDSINYTGARLQTLFPFSWPLPSLRLAFIRRLSRSSVEFTPIPVAALCRLAEQPRLNPTETPSGITRYRGLPR